MLSFGRVSSEKVFPVVNENILALQSSPPVAMRQLSFERRQQFKEASSPFLKSATNSSNFINFLQNIRIKDDFIKVVPFILEVNLIQN